MSEIIELRWNCSSCASKNILGREKECPSCGSPREKGEMVMTAEEDAPAVTDAALLELANAGADWFCAHCAAGNRGDRAHCMKCGASRHTVSRAPHTPNTRPPEPPKYEAPEPPKYESNKSYFVVGGVLVLLIAFGVWAMQSHTVVGVVARMSWSRTTTCLLYTSPSPRDS